MPHNTHTHINYPMCTSVFPQHLDVLTLQYQPRLKYIGKEISLQLVVQILAMSLGKLYAIMGNGRDFMVTAPQVSEYDL